MSTNNNPDVPLGGLATVLFFVVMLLIAGRAGGVLTMFKRAHDHPTSDDPAASMIADLFWWAWPAAALIFLTTPWWGCLLV